MIGRKNAITVLIAVLLIGCLLGATGIWLWRQRAQNNANIGNPYIQHGYSDRIFDRLDITPEQEARLKKILEDSRREINDCRSELQNKMDDIRIRTNERIAAILDENQKGMFEQLINEAESQRGGNHHGRGRNMPGH